MPDYIPNTLEEQRAMLKEIGVDAAEDLFACIPESVRLKKRLLLAGEGMAEGELLKHMRGLSLKNRNLDECICFLGAGAYDHHIPAIVEHIVSRQEFYTSYTPYQPEMSQGMLQAIFEYQTMVCELTGMDAANASMYDGATALAEAAVMACRATGRREAVIPRTLSPENARVLNTYARFGGITVNEAGYDDGKINLEDIERKITQETAAVIMQNPNFFGIIEDVSRIGEMAHRKGALLIVSVDPISLGLLKPPGEAGADIAVGEGQSLGSPLCFGGPCLGFFAASGALVRRMPGRIVGQTTDRSGKRAFVLTLQAREQHIRREKATSNICTNQALNALAASVYLAVMGKEGLRKAAELCFQKAHYAHKRLIESGKFAEVFKAPFFKEFVLKSGEPVAELNRRLLKEGIIGGYDLGGSYAELENGWLVAVTEKRTKDEIDKFVRLAGEFR